MHERLLRFLEWHRPSVVLTNDFYRFIAAKLGKRPLVAGPRPINSVLHSYGRIPVVANLVRKLG